MVTKVAEPSKYGVVLLDEESGQVKEFVEKPPVFVGNRIDSGIYLPSTDVLSHVSPRLMLLERQVFPSIAAEGGLYAMVHAGFLDGRGTAQGLPRRSQTLPGLPRGGAAQYRESAGGRQREGGGKNV